MNYLEEDRVPKRCALAGAAYIALQIYMGSTLAGCVREPVDEAPPLAEAAEIIVEPAQLTLQAGGEAWLAGQVNDATGQPIGGAVLRFQTADPHLLAVSAEGLVSSLGPATVQSHVVVDSGGRERLVPVVVTPGPPQRLEKLSGDGQSVVAGNAPAAPLVARLVDGWSNALGGIAVTVKSAAGLFAPGEVVTAADGTAKFDVPRLTQAGTVIVVLQADAADGPVESFQIEVVPAAPVEVAIAPASMAEARQPNAQVTITLRVIDSHGNPVPDIDVGTRFVLPDAPAVQSRSDSAGSVLVLIPPGVGPGQASLEVELPAVPEFRRTLTVEVAPPAAPESTEGSS